VTSNGLLTWTLETGAAYYAISRDGQVIAIRDASQGGSFQDVADGQAHTYEVAAASDYDPAQPPVFSAAVTEAPVGVAYSEGVLSWSAVDGHAGLSYEVLIGGWTFAITTGTSYAVPSWVLSFFPSGHVSASVASLDANDNPISAPSAPLSFTYLVSPATDAAVLDATQTPGVLVVFYDVTGAASYDIYEGGTSAADLVASGVNGSAAVDYIEHEVYPPSSASGTLTYYVTAVAPDGSQSAPSQAMSVNW